MSRLSGAVEWSSWSIEDILLRRSVEAESADRASHERPQGECRAFWHSLQRHRRQGSAARHYYITARNAVRHVQKDQNEILSASNDESKSKSCRALQNPRLLMSGLCVCVVLKV